MRFLAELSTQIKPTLVNSLGVWHTIISYTIGVISIIFLFLSFQMKDRKKILIVNTLGSFGWICYFLLQGDLVSGFTGSVSIIRTIIFLFRDKHAWAKSIVWLFVFIALTVTFTVMSYNSYKDLFPLCANILATLSFYMIKERNIRFFSLGCYSFWMCNSISKGYWIALVSDTCALVSVIISLIRYNKQNNIKVEE